MEASTNPPAGLSLAPETCPTCGGQTTPWDEFLKGVTFVLCCNVGCRSLHRDIGIAVGAEYYPYSRYRITYGIDVARDGPAVIVAAVTVRRDAAPEYITLTIVNPPETG